jgi:hypothetical protein
MAKNEAEQEFTSGDKVVFIPEGKTYDFGYYCRSPGRAVIYEEGARNMQDSYSVPLGSLELEV